LPESLRRTLDERLRRPSPNLRPAVGGDPVERFVAKMRAVNGIVTRVPDLAAVAPVVGTHLETHRLPARLVVAPDPALDPIPWSNALEVERRAATGDDRASVTGAFAGIAETGTLMLLSGPESPTTLNFLPDDHLVVLAESRIVRHLEDGWAWLRQEVPAMPRTVNLITGPSKTADVELTIQEGAHGPRRLHVILVGI
jgi:L-lactate dehydrogenase complex protein LldG